MYRMDGRPVGRVSAERVYDLSGQYVGELFKGMVVEKPVGVRTKLPPVATPPNMQQPPGSVSRVRTSYGYPDVFHRLSGDDAKTAAGGQNEV